MTATYDILAGEQALLKRIDSPTNRWMMTHHLGPLIYVRLLVLSIPAAFAYMRASLVELVEDLSQAFASMRVARRVFRAGRHALRMVSYADQADKHAQSARARADVARNAHQAELRRAGLSA